MRTELQRAEQKIETRSESLKKPLGLFDLVLTQILFVVGSRISATSVHVTGSSRLPMVAGWDRLLPNWFSRLHPRYKTPVNSIIFVGATILLIAIASQIGAGIQEAFQLVDNAANVFYGIVYFTMFAIPIFGARAVRSGASIWFRMLLSAAQPSRCPQFSSPSIQLSTSRAR